VSNRHAYRAVIVALAALIALALTPTGAGADTDVDPGIAAALQRVADKTYTDADLDYLRQFPEIAAQVPDPEAPEESSVSAKAPTGSTIDACGWWVDVGYRKRSLLGFTLYVFHHYLQYCLSGSAVASWQARYDYLTNVDSVIYQREQVPNQQAGLGSYTAWSHIGRHLEYCVIRYGCYANTYPWSKIWVNAGGYYWRTGSAG